MTEKPMITKEMIGAAQDLLLASGDVILSYRLLEKIYRAMREKEPKATAEPSAKNWRINSDKSAAVATDYYWIDDMATCPVGVKVQLLTIGDVSAYGKYDGKNKQGCTAWAPMPKIRKPRPTWPEGVGAADQPPACPPTDP